MTECALGCRTRDGYPFPAPEGYQVCDRCITRIRDTLDEIAERWRRIVPTHALLPVPQGIERRSPGYASAPPGNVHVMALRDVRTVAVEPRDLRSPLEVVHTWASSVRQWRVITAPHTATVDSETNTLKFHLDFIVRQFPPDSLALFAEELTSVCVQLRAVTDDGPSPVVGYCTADVNGQPIEDGEDRQRCGAPLRLPEGGCVIRCPACHATYHGHELLRMYQEAT